MANKNPTQPDAEAVVEQVTKLTLNEFCVRLSETVSRPELIGAFENAERRARRLKDTEAAFRARFDDFINTPV